MKESEKIKQYAKDLIDMEDSHDYSMFGFYADRLTESYASQRSLKVIEFFDDIMTRQIEKVGSYGDADVTITKLDVKGLPKERQSIGKPPVVTYEALQLIVECNDYAFFVISKKRDIGHFCNREIFVYYCEQDRIDSINLSKIMKSGTPGDRNFSFCITVHDYGDEDKIVEFSRFHDFPHNTFYHFKQVYKELRSISNYGFNIDE